MSRFKTSSAVLAILAALGGLCRAADGADRQCDAGAGQALRGVLPGCGLVRADRQQPGGGPGRAGQQPGVVGGALLGTALGAGLGAAVGGGRGAAIGAASGAAGRHRLWRGRQQQRAIRHPEGNTTTPMPNACIRGAIRCRAITRNPRHPRHRPAGPFRRRRITKTKRRARRDDGQNHVTKQFSDRSGRRR